MADFEGNMNLNVETSEIEIKGKFKLTEDELDTVVGGSYTVYTAYMCGNCGHTWLASVVEMPENPCSSDYYDMSASSQACPRCHRTAFLKFTCNGLEGYNRFLIDYPLSE